MEILKILSNFKPKNHHFGHFGFGCKKSSKFEENPIINIYSLVPQIDHPAALCVRIVVKKTSVKNMSQEGNHFFKVQKSFCREMTDGIKLILKYNP